MLKVIFKEAYSYLLMQDGEDWYLTFLTGGPFVQDISVRLNEQEIARVRDSQVAAAQLAREFLRDSALYEGRRITPAVHPKQTPNAPSH
ncbi:hypothetical protein O5O45_08695 [Hahella aquimaris]|uniref:hypothetical protein n=1 Tax=Hahella sp. HNIBRBA332 TaxID=3015983 RepID=UPI00273CB12E|nr:hypothetical protein [Hahella sp. HNIBRBA332]WLQ15990.1 hypothetical protein O5O45_08695 [Hahella sp. HNIBRBA332]